MSYAPRSRAPITQYNPRAGPQPAQQDDFYRPQPSSSTWRNSASQRTVSPLHGQSSVGGPSTNGQVTLTIPPLARGYRDDGNTPRMSIRLFTLGTIFTAPTFEALLDHKIQPGHYTRVESIYGPICMAVAMFTHQNTGGDNQVQQQVIGLRRKDDREYEGPKGNPYKPLDIADIGDMHKDTSVVHLLHMGTFETKHQLKIQGHLTASSAIYLAELSHALLKDCKDRATPGCKPATVSSRTNVQANMDRYRVRATEDSEDPEQTTPRAVAFGDSRYGSAASYQQSGRSWAQTAGSTAQSRVSTAARPSDRATVYGRR